LRFLLVADKMGKLKAYEIRAKNKEQTKQQLGELKKSLAELRVSKVSGQGGPSKLAQM
jgi:ribosomal protein L29